MAASLVFRLHDRGPELVREVLLERGWEEYNEGEREEEDWNLYWRGSLFQTSQYHNLLPWQRLNHHPKTVGITRKDCLARNLRRMKATFGSALYDFSPTTFILPNDYTCFLAEYNRLRLARGTSVYWIVKPVDLSRGRGIFIFEDIKDLVYDCSVVIQRYISSSLLISGYKFDLRIYVCVKSFHPLTVYIHQEGLVRFATEKFNLSSLHNLYAHLTNTSINKFGPFYKTEKGRVGRGCKWTMSKFRHFLHSQQINELLLWQRINNIVTLTLLAIATSVPSCPNCVELFGFDILIDAKFKPWLLEVNYSPALTLDCQADISVKKKLVSDVIDMMNYTSTDSLRDRAYRKHRYKQPCFKANHPSAPVLSTLNHQKKKRGNKGSHTQILPLLKTSHQPEKTKRGKLKQRDLETDISSLTPDTQESEEVFTRPAASWKLPNIYRYCKFAKWNGQNVPPVKVGDFIRTFPFNRATLKASQHELDIRTVLQEIQSLTGQLVSGKGHKMKSRREEKVTADKDADTDFDSLLWGPKDPPLISQFFKST
uniref:Tubulin tyrosine ligase-like family, member 2 n=1 Tax=Maylandia zebra TaxID=106582 RepID=A0A3P9CUY8_9CICH